MSGLILPIRDAFGLPDHPDHPQWEVVGYVNSSHSLSAFTLTIVPCLRGHLRALPYRRFREVRMR